MTNYNERLDEIIADLSGESFDAAINNPKDYAQIVIDAEIEAKQAITSLTKELVAEAKPEIPVATSWQQGIEKKAFEDAIRVYEYKLLKALEEIE